MTKMDRKACIDFANENPLCFLATLDGDQPRVRAVLMDNADESGFYFATLTPKEMSSQMHANPKVEICFYNNASDLMAAKMMRVCGEVEFIDDPEAKERALKSREGLSQIVGEPIEPYTEIFRISCGDIHFWTMMDVMKEKQLQHLKF